ncbi:MAG: hypothetical protein ACE5FI_11815 [Anaerolineales bacterium]
MSVSFEFKTVIVLPALLVGALALSACSGLRSELGGIFDGEEQPAIGVSGPEATEGSGEYFPVNEETPQSLDLYADEPEYLPPGEFEPIDPLPQPTFEIVEPGALGDPVAAEQAAITDSGSVDVTANPQTTWHGLVVVGDEQHDHQYVGFIEFDLSPFAGKRVTSAEFDTGSCRTAGAPIHLMPFTLVNANTNQVLASFTSCSYQVDVTLAVSAAKSSGRLRFNIALNGVAADGIEDSVAFSAPSLVVVYTP